MTWSTHTLLTVYDTLGQKIATLVDQTIEAGTNQVTFDAGMLFSGVCIYQPDVDGQRQVGQMILLK